MSTAASKDVKRWCGNRHLSLIRPPVQRALLWSLPSFCFFSLARAEAVAEMCTIVRAVVITSQMIWVLALAQKFSMRMAKASDWLELWNSL